MSLSSPTSPILDLFPNKRPVAVFAIQQYLSLLASFPLTRKGSWNVCYAGVTQSPLQRIGGIGCVIAAAGVDKIKPCP